MVTSKPVALKERIPNIGPVRLLEATIVTVKTPQGKVRRLPFAVVSYTVEGQKQEYGLRLDMDKRIFIDHFDNEWIEQGVQKAAPEIVGLLCGKSDEDIEVE